MFDNHPQNVYRIIKKPLEDNSSGLDSMCLI